MSASEYRRLPPEVRPFEAALHEYIAHNRKDIFDTIAETGRLEDDTIAQLEDVTKEVKAQFAADRKSGSAGQASEAQPAGAAR